MTSGYRPYMDILIWTETRTVICMCYITQSLSCHRDDVSLTVSSSPQPPFTVVYLVLTSALSATNSSSTYFIFWLRSLLL